MTEQRLQEIKADIKRGRKYDVPNDWDCNYEQIYDDKEELVVAVEQLQTEVKRLENDTAELEDAIRKNSKPTGWLI